MRLLQGRLKRWVAALALLAATAILGSTAWAGAAPTREATHLHNARYCEIIEVKGTPPDVVVTVTPVDRIELPATTRTLVPEHGRPRL